MLNPFKYRLWCILLLIAAVLPNCQKQLTPKNYYTEVINIEKSIPPGSKVQVRTSPGLSGVLTTILKEKKIQIGPESNYVILLERSSLTMQFKFIDAGSGAVLYALSCELREEGDLEFAIGYALDQIMKADGLTKQFGPTKPKAAATITAKPLPTPKSNEPDPLAPGSGSDDFSEETVEE